MIQFLLSAARTAIGSAEAKTAASAAARTIRPPITKPSRLFKRAVPRPGRVPTRPTTKPVAPSLPTRVPATTPKPEHAGNRQPLDKTATSDYKEPKISKETIPPETPPTEKASTTDTLARLIATSNLVSSQLSSFVPSITWSGNVSAVGFKTTPLRTVLHYCLALVFGLVHQSRLGNTSIKVDLYPTKNKVEVTFINASTMLLEPLNVAAKAVADNTGLIVRIATAPFDIIRKLGGSEGTSIVESIRRIANLDVSGMVGEIASMVGNASRYSGPAGIWDMAQSNIYAGLPPATMMIQGIQPYTNIALDSIGRKQPMLTRSLAINPQAPVVPNMHYPTHFDLRSLVAQALYDPGVLPPSPDTNVALPTVKNI